MKFCPNEMDRIVIDTNTIVSYLINGNSVPGRAYIKAASKGLLLVSTESLLELKDVLSRPKFSKYFRKTNPISFYKTYEEVVKFIDILHPIRACRDPKDDKFLELAFNGMADLIVTGDKDLLTLNPFEGIRIVSPAEYLELD